MGFQLAAGETGHSRHSGSSRKDTPHLEQTEDIFKRRQEPEGFHALGLIPTRDTPLLSSSRSVTGPVWMLWLPHPPPPHAELLLVLYHSVDGWEPVWSVISAILIWVVSVCFFAQDPQRQSMMFCQAPAHTVYWVSIQSSQISGSRSPFPCLDLRCFLSLCQKQINARCVWWLHPVTLLLFIFS